MATTKGRSTTGRKQLVETSKIFDEREYLELNPDVAIAVDAGETDALTHFVKFGWSENRRFSRFFNSTTYLEKNQDVAAAVAIEATSVSEHFFEFGISESRQVNALLDLDYYLNAHTDVAAAVASGTTTALQHYFQFGISEARSYTSYFGAILNRETFQSTFQTEIGASFDIQSSSQLSDDEVIDLVVGLGDRAIDFAYYRDRHAVSLEDFFGVAAFELSNDQIRAFAFNQGETAGLSRTSVNLQAYAATYSAQLVEFYSVAAISEVTESEIERFALGAGIAQGLDVTAFLDVAYYRSEYSAAATARFGAEFTDAQLVSYIFGDAAPFIDTDYYQQLFGQNTTASGELVADLDTDELRRYALTEGFDADTALSPFDLEACRTQNAATLTQFYGVADAATLTQQQIRDFLVNDAWSFGISIAIFTDSAAVELYRAQNREAIAQRYSISVDAVSQLSAEVVLDFEFGGASEAIDFDYIRSTFVGDAQAAFGTATALQATDAQILDYVYSLNTAIAGTTFTALDYQGYRARYTQEIATALEISVAEVLQLDFDAIESFIFNEGASLNLSLTEFANVSYLRSTFSAAIAQSFSIEASAVGQLSDAQVTGWFVSESRDLDIDFLRFQIESLSVGQQAQLFASAGLTFDATAFITTEQVLTLSLSAEFASFFQAEELQLAVIDIDAYAETNVCELYEFYFGAEVVLSEQTGKSTKRTAGGFKVSSKRSKSSKSGKSGTRGRGTGRGTKQSRTTLKNLAATLKTKKTKSGTGTGRGTKTTNKTDTGSISVVADSGSDSGAIAAAAEPRRNTSNSGTAKTGTKKSTKNAGGGTAATVKTTKKTGSGTGKHTKNTQKSDTGTVVVGTGNDTTVDVDITIEAKLESVQQLSREQVVSFMFGRGAKLGLETAEFIEVDFLRHAFEAELLAIYQVSTTKEIDDRLVIDLVYGGLSSEIDFEFYRTTHAAQIAADYGLSIEQITDTLVLEHAYEFGIDRDLDLAAFDNDEILLSQSETGAEDAAADSIDLTEFVDVDFLRTEFEADLLTEYRVENVYNVDAEQTLEFFEGRGRTFGGLNLSAAIDFDFYRSTYAAQISANSGAIDTDSSGAIDDLELLDYITGAGLESGQNPSKLVDFEAYRAAGSASATALVAYYGKTTIEEVTFRETLEYMFGAGLERGFAPSQAIDLATIRAENAAVLTAFYQVSSVEQVSLTQTFNYAFGAGFDDIGAAIAS